MCDIAPTTHGEADCAFCGYRRSAKDRPPRLHAETERLIGAFDHLHRWSVRYVALSGGEPALHPNLPQLVAEATRRNLRVHPGEQRL